MLSFGSTTSIRRQQSVPKAEAETNASVTFKMFGYFKKQHNFSVATYTWFTKRRKPSLRKLFCLSHLQIWTKPASATAERIIKSTVL